MDAGWLEPGQASIAPNGAPPPPAGAQARLATTARPPLGAPGPCQAA
jgi:hypothetical protein